MKDKEEEFIDLASKHFDNAGVIIDIGGFSGKWTDIVRDRDGNKKIFIYEPNPEMFNRLKEKYKEYRNIEIKNVGISSRNNLEKYYKLIESDEIVQMSGFVKREVYNQYKVEESLQKTVTLDSEIEGNMDFVKIDTEGFEFEVLKGMKNILESKRVKFIQFEYGGTYLDKKIGLNDIIAYLGQFGYKVYDLKDGGLTQIEDYIDDYTYNNFISTFL